jgi:hypothetical protein
MKASSRSPTHSPDIIPTDFFLFLRAKLDLAGLLLSQECFKASWDLIVQIIAKDKFAHNGGRWTAAKSMFKFAVTRTRKVLK